ncbi:MAG TPA: MBL fold metallo-hydrolase [Thermoanaerobaculia bacterium]|nr:MBL fold metallo-hydrolase [Thermoanaerobaculia bacterium]
MTFTLRETRLRENVWVWTPGGDRIETSYGANCTAVVGRDSVLVVDPLIAPSFARLVAGAISKKTSLPVEHVVVTHHHTDHSLGASWFARRGATVVAHPACRDAMAAEHPALVAARRQVPELAELFRDADPYLPGLTVEDSVTLNLGGSRARVLHPGYGHTAGDLVVELEPESVVVCGDLVSASYHVNYEDAAVENLERGLRMLSALDARTYVPGHGPAGDAGILDDQLAYHAAAARAPDADALRERFPHHALPEVLPGSLAVWRKSRTR